MRTPSWNYEEKSLLVSRSWYNVYNVTIHTEFLQIAKHNLHQILSYQTFYPKTIYLFSGEKIKINTKPSSRNCFSFFHLENIWVFQISSEFLLIIECFGNPAFSRILFILMSIIFCRFMWHSPCLIWTIMSVLRTLAELALIVFYRLYRLYRSRICQHY